MTNAWECQSEWDICPNPQFPWCLVFQVSSTWSLLPHGTELLPVIQNAQIEVPDPGGLGSSLTPGNVARVCTSCSLFRDGEVNKYSWNHWVIASRVEREILGADQFQTQSYTISDNYIWEKLSVHLKGANYFAGQYYLLNQPESISL